MKLTPTFSDLVLDDQTPSAESLRGLLPHGSRYLDQLCFGMSSQFLARLLRTNLRVQNLNQDWGFGGEGLLWALWGFWWLDSAVSYLCAFGMLYAMYVPAVPDILRPPY